MFLTVSGTAERLATKKLIETDFKSLSSKEVASHLGNPDMRIRQKAQFELVKRKDGLDFLKRSYKSEE